MQDNRLALDRIVISGVRSKQELWLFVIGALGTIQKGLIGHLERG